MPPKKYQHQNGGGSNRRNVNNSNNSNAVNNRSGESADHKEAGQEVEETTHTRGWSPKKSSQGDHQEKEEVILKHEKKSGNGRKKEVKQEQDEEETISGTAGERIDLEEYIGITKRFVASLGTSQEKDRAMMAVIKTFQMKTEELLMLAAQVVKKEEEASSKPALAPPKEVSVSKRTKAPRAKTSAAGGESTNESVEQVENQSRKKTPPPPPMSIEDIGKNKRTPPPPPPLQAVNKIKPSTSQKEEEEEDDEDEVVLMTPSESNGSPAVVSASSMVVDKKKEGQFPPTATDKMRGGDQSSADPSPPSTGPAGTAAPSNSSCQQEEGIGIRADATSTTKTAASSGSSDKNSVSSPTGPSHKDQLLPPTGLGDESSLGTAQQKQQVGVIGSPASLPATSVQYQASSGFPASSPSTQDGLVPPPPGYGTAHPPLPPMTTSHGVDVDAGFSPFQSESPFLSHSNSAVATPAGQSQQVTQRLTPPAQTQPYTVPSPSKARQQEGKSLRRFPDALPSNNLLDSNPSWALLHMEHRDLVNTPYIPLEHPFDREYHAQHLIEDEQLQMFTTETDPKDFDPRIVYTISEYVLGHLRRVDDNREQLNYELLQWCCMYCRKLTTREGDFCLSFDMENGSMVLREMCANVIDPLLRARFLLECPNPQLLIELLWCVNNLVLLPVPLEYIPPSVGPSFNTASFYESSEFVIRNKLLLSLIRMILRAPVVGASNELSVLIRTQALMTLAALLTRHPELRRVALEARTPCRQDEVGHLLLNWKNLLLGGGGTILPGDWTKERVEQIIKDSGRDILAPTSERGGQQQNQQRVMFALTDVLVSIASKPSWGSNSEREKASLCLSLLLADGAQDFPHQPQVSTRALVTRRHDDSFLAALCVQLENSTDVDTQFTALLGFWKIVHVTKNTEEEQAVCQEVIGKCVLPRLPQILENMYPVVSFALDVPQRASEVLALLFNLLYPLIQEEKVTTSSGGTNKTSSPARGPSLSVPSTTTSLPGLPPPPQPSGPAQLAKGIVERKLIGRSPSDRESDALFLLLCKVLSSCNPQSNYNSAFDMCSSNKYGISVLEDCVFSLYSNYLRPDLMILECCAYLRIHASKGSLTTRSRMLVDTLTVDSLAEIARGYGGGGGGDQPITRQQLGQQPRMDALSILINLANQQRGAANPATEEVVQALLQSRATMSFAEAISEAQRLIAYWAQPEVVGSTTTSTASGQELLTNKSSSKLDLSTDLVKLMDALEVLGGIVAARGGEEGSNSGGLPSVAASACGCFPGVLEDPEREILIRQAHADIKDALEWFSEAEEIMNELNMAGAADILSQAEDLKREYFDSSVLPALAAIKSEVPAASGVPSAATPDDATKLRQSKPHKKGREKKKDRVEEDVGSEKKQEVSETSSTAKEKEPKTEGKKQGPKRWTRGKKKD